MSPAQRSAMVTGASSGIGAATVGRLIDKGFLVWASVRASGDADRLRTRYGQRVRPLVMDLTDDDTVRAAARVVADDGPLSALVNNAGTAVAGPLESMPLESLRRQLEVNVIGQLAVTQAALPSLIAAADAYGEARIVMIGSIGGRVSTPMLGAYNASKHALVGLTGSLAAELRPSGVRVTLVEPGATATPIWKGVPALADPTGPTGPVGPRYAAMIAASQRRARRSEHSGMPPERVADVVVDTLTRRHPPLRRLVGRQARALAALDRLLPERVLAALLAAHQGQLGDPSTAAGPRPRHRPASPRA